MLVDIKRENPDVDVVVLKSAPSREGSGHKLDVLQ